MLKKTFLFLLVCVLITLVSCEQLKNIQDQEYVIMFNTNGGTPMNPITAHPKNPVYIKSNPVKEGYTFDGWYTDSDFTNEFTPVMPDKNTMLFAKWSANQYTITFEDTDIPKIILNYGDVIKLPEGPQKIPYIFQGWYEGNKIFDLTTMPARDITLNTSWLYNDTYYSDETPKWITNDVASSLYYVGFNESISLYINILITNNTSEAIDLEHIELKIFNQDNGNLVSHFEDNYRNHYIGIHLEPGIKKLYTKEIPISSVYTADVDFQKIIWDLDVTYVPCRSQ